MPTTKVGYPSGKRRPLDLIRGWRGASLPKFESGPCQIQIRTEGLTDSTLPAHKNRPATQKLRKNRVPEISGNFGKTGRAASEAGRQIRSRRLIGGPARKIRGPLRILWVEPHGVPGHCRRRAALAQASRPIKRCTCVAEQSLSPRAVGLPRAARLRWPSATFRRSPVAP
jgi:hypothetical protein